MQNTWTPGWNMSPGCLDNLPGPEQNLLVITGLAVYATAGRGNGRLTL